MTFLVKKLFRGDRRLPSDSRKIQARSIALKKKIGRSKLRTV
jgi:hypothetical protein